MGEVILDALLDALKLLPFLLLLYILIELLEHKTAMGRPQRALAGRAAPLIGAAAGLVPMCGFSVMAGKLYERKYLTVGTLLSVFIATSDEAFLVLLLSGMAWTEKLLSLVAFCGCKLVLGAGAGYLIDLISKKRRKSALCPYDLPGEEHEHGEGEPAVCEHRHDGGWVRYLLSPLLHALEVAAVIFLFNIAFGALFYYVGQDRVIGFLQNAGLWYQPVFACLVGMIPNCASSVVLAEVYAVGGITFGSCLGGLVTNAGPAILVLFRHKKAWKHALFILILTFLAGVAAGYLVNAVMLLF